MTLTEARWTIGLLLRVSLVCVSRAVIAGHLNILTRYLAVKYEDGVKKTILKIKLQDKQ